MPLELKSKRFQYHTASFLQSKGNLEKLVSAALAKFSIVGDRVEKVDQAGSMLRFVNAPANRLSMAFGDMLTYEPGANKLLATVDMRNTSLDVNQITPPQTTDGKRTEFIDAMLFYGLKDNHVVVCGSQALRVGHLERHINWLLWEAKVMPLTDRVSLIDKPNADVRKRVEKLPVKSATVKIPVVELDGDAAESDETVATPSVKIGAAVLRVILGENRFAKLHIEKAAEGNLQVELKVSYLRSTTAGGQAVLNATARAMRTLEIDPDNLKVDVPGVGELKGSELKITDTRQIQTVNGIPGPLDVYDKMHEWLLSLLENKLVE